MIWQNALASLSAFRRTTRTTARHTSTRKQDFQSCAAVGALGTTNFLLPRLPLACRVSGHSRWLSGCCDPRRRATQSEGQFLLPIRAAEGRCHCWPLSVSAAASSRRSCCWLSGTETFYTGDGRFKDSLKWRGTVGWKFLEIAGLMLGRTAQDMWNGLPTC